MVVCELVRGERNPVYEQLEVDNASRQYSFLLSLIDTALALDQRWLSQRVIKALNHHAIACLHDYAGEYRPCKVELGDDPRAHKPPPPHAVPSQMDQFINHLNVLWRDPEKDSVGLAAYVLWRLNYIHPFINGNGRTARSAAYYVLCLKLGGPLPGKKTLPELLVKDRDHYVNALRIADRSYEAGNKLDLKPLTKLIIQMMRTQVESGRPDATA